MKTSNEKKLVMVGIHRKGDKGFKIRVRQDIQFPVSGPAIVNRNTEKPPRETIREV